MEAAPGRVEMELNGNMNFKRNDFSFFDSKAKIGPEGLEGSRSAVNKSFFKRVRENKATRSCTAIAKPRRSANSTHAWRRRCRGPTN